jgi:hypothetical protein
VSVESITWALKVPVPASSAKFVLVVLANQANDETGLAFPSIAYLAEATGQDRKTVIGNIAKLIDWGLIEDSGQRVGATKQVIVYRLLKSADLFAEQSQKRNSSKIGTVPKTDGNSTVFPPKQSQKRDTEPSTNHQEPEKQKLSAQPAAARFADWWAVYPKHVARKKAEAIWRNRKLDAIADRLIHDVLTRASDDDGWRRGYVPDPTTYLNQDRWEDDLRTAPVARAGPTQQQPSKTLSAVQTLQGMKHGNLAPRRDSGRIEQAPLLELGSDSGK